MFMSTLSSVISLGKHTNEYSGVTPITPDEILVLIGFDEYSTGYSSTFDDEISLLDHANLGTVTVDTENVLGTHSVFFDQSTVNQNKGIGLLPSNKGIYDQQDLTSLREQSTIRFKFKRQEGLSNPLASGYEVNGETLISCWRTSGEGNASWKLSINNPGGDLVLDVSSNGTSITSSINCDLSGEQNSGWHEYALTSNGVGVWEIYFDGIKVGSSNLGLAFKGAGTPTNIHVGRCYSILTTSAGGYFDEIRMSSVVEFTGNYTPTVTKFPRS